MIKLFLPPIVFLLFLTGCMDKNVHPFFQPASKISVEDYSTFQEYLQKTEKLVAENRYFLTDSFDAEIKANVPFEIKPEKKVVPSKGVLLVHGLGDSPFSFTDIGKKLASEGFLVRTILLAGHGTKPGDMLVAKHEEWEKLVTRQVQLLKSEVDTIYLGGFSTGGNLVYLEAEKDPQIKGLMLFSPAFISDEPLAPCVALLTPFIKWLIRGDFENETNYVRYGSMPTKGFVEYQATSKDVMNRLLKSDFDRPVFMVLSEHDSVLDSEKIKDLFNTRFTHPQSRLLWFGSEPSGQKGRTRYVNSYMPELRITNMSHVGVLFSPTNPYYGINGTQKICRNHRRESAERDQAYCREGNPVWYSAWDGDDGTKVHARLTFNPVFDLMMDDLALTFAQ